MKRLLALTTVVAVGLVACGDDQQDTGPTTSTTTASSTTSASPPVDDPESGTTDTQPVTTTSPPAGSTADIAVTEVVFGDHVTLTNLGAGQVSLEGLWLCNRPFYAPLPDRSLAPGESIEADAAPLGELPALGGEIALYRSDDFESADEMLDYVTWGRGGGRTRAAVEVGLWPEGDTVTVVGNSISAPLGGSTSADWTP